jgi:Transposase DDE domain
MIVSATQQSKESKPMSHDTPKLSDQKVLDQARAVLKDHLSLEAEGYVCTTDDLYNALLGVAANRGTLQAVCTDWLDIAEPETVRGYLNDQLCVEDLPALERQLNAALAAQTPKRIYRTPQDVAIDFHDRPYYGKQPQNTGLWVRGRAKDGTTRFYRIATAYVMLNGLRVTLALRFVLPEADTVTVLQDLLKRLHLRAIRIACLFLDKGFNGIAIMRYLTGRGQPALIACTIRGKQGGTRALCVGPKSYRTTYAFESAEQGEFTASLAVCRAFTTAKRANRLKRRVEWLIYILIHLNLSPRQARRLYRRRFGIESSYRCAGQVRGWTTSPNAAYRFVLIALSFILLNVWLGLRWLFTQMPRRGRRWLDVKRFQLVRFAKFLRRALEQRYGSVSEIVAVAAPRP